LVKLEYFKDVGLMTFESNAHCSNVHVKNITYYY